MLSKKEKTITFSPLSTTAPKTKINTLKNLSKTKQGFEKGQQKQKTSHINWVYIEILESHIIYFSMSLSYKSLYTHSHT